jgi:hypothetical protein
MRRRNHPLDGRDGDVVGGRGFGYAGQHVIASCGELAGDILLRYIDIPLSIYANEELLP